MVDISIIRAARDRHGVSFMARRDDTLLDVGSIEAAVIPAHDGTFRFAKKKLGIATNSVMHIVEVEVEKKYRGRGIGKALYVAVLSDARRRGIPLVSSNLLGGAYASLTRSAARVWASLLAARGGFVTEDGILDREDNVEHGYVIT